MTDATPRNVMIMAGIVLALGTGVVYEPVFADSGTSTFPNYTFTTDRDSGVVREMAAMEEMSDVLGTDLQPTTKAHITTTFPNSSIIAPGPAPAVGYASSVSSAPRNQEFSPWVRPNP